MLEEMAKSYDDMPYDSKPFLQSHPDRLASLATLHGMRPAPIEGCRVLELGCAAGGNLLPMACALPHSTFLGIELSGRQVKDGNAVVAALGQRNAEIRQLSITDVAPALGTFDYIIAHGVYSWVPPAVQDALLRICRENLAPQGVAYISYNTYPGWHTRSVVRDMMLYHTRQFDDPQTRVSQARAMLEFMAHSVGQGSHYATILNGELAMLRRQGDDLVYHEHLEEANAPVYFHEFAARLTRHGLQYLADTEFSTTYPGNFPAPVMETLSRVSGDFVRTEQYLDFLVNRAFRHSLVCREEAKLDRSLPSQRLRTLHLACRARPDTADPSARDDRAVTFRLDDAQSYTTASPLEKAALVMLGEAWPQSVAFGDLVVEAARRCGNAAPVDAEASLGAMMVQAYAKSFVLLRSRKAEFVTQVSERPCVSPLARIQAKAGPMVTNQLHELVAMDSVSRQVIQLLDGRGGVAAVAERVGAAASSAHLDMLAKRAFLIS